MTFLGARSIKFHHSLAAASTKKASDGCGRRQSWRNHPALRPPWPKIDPDWIEAAAGDVVTRNGLEPKWGAQPLGW